MACYSRLLAYRPSDGGRLRFESKHSAVHRTDNEFKLALKCGQCIGCRLERAKDWAIRSVHEAQMHEHNSFLTLTYRDEDLPDDRGLDVSHWQNFAKLVRKHYGKFRFLHCGEYSDPPYFRPHYHALVFGHDWKDERLKLRREPGKAQLYMAPGLQLLWPHGHHSIGDVSWTSASYVADYTLKKITGDRAKEHYERVDGKTGECWEVKPEYSTMSRNKGLGNTWFEKYYMEVYPEDQVRLEGRTLRPPAYYDGLLKKKDEEMHEKVETKRRKKVEENKDNQTEERLEVRREIAEAKIRLKNRH